MWAPVRAVRSQPANTREMRGREKEKERKRKRVREIEIERERERRESEINNVAEGVIREIEGQDRIQRGCDTKG